MIVVSGHQPAYLPWLGLLHKASLADVFIFMDDVQFIERDFIHRNRILDPNGHVHWLTVPIEKNGASKLCIKDISIRRSSGEWQKKHWKLLQLCYSHTPFFYEYGPFFEWFYCDCHWVNLAEMNWILLKQFFHWFGIKTHLIRGSEEHFTEKKSRLVMEHGLRFHADIVVTGEFGEKYINYEEFLDLGIKVVHQHYIQHEYPQGSNTWNGFLSSVDMLFRLGPASSQTAFANNLTRDEL